jgi:hypothetical protein
MKRKVGVALVALALVATPLGAQKLESEGQAFLTALKEGNKSKAKPRC